MRVSAWWKAQPPVIDAIVAGLLLAAVGASCWYGRRILGPDTPRDDDPMFSTMSVLGSGQVIRHHGPEVCAGAACCIHHPSGHIMRTWPLYLDDRPEVPYHLMWRMCEHGAPHVDPDTIDWSRREGRWIVIDTDRCDGCCRGICESYGC